MMMDLWDPAKIFNEDNVLHPGGRIETWLLRLLAGPRNEKNLENIFKDMRPHQIISQYILSLDSNQHKHMSTSPVCDDSGTQK